MQLTKNSGDLDDYHDHRLIGNFGHIVVGVVFGPSNKMDLNGVRLRQKRNSSFSSKNRYLKLLEKIGIKLWKT